MLAEVVHEVREQSFGTLSMTARMRSNGFVFRSVAAGAGIVAGTMIVVGMLTSCIGASDNKPAGEAATVAAGRRCPVTVPRKRITVADQSFNYGNESLRVELWPHGKLVAGPLADGSLFAQVHPDGSIEAKLGWWRGVPGRLTVEGQMLNDPSKRLRVDVPEGYGDRGFQPSGLVFPADGCWRVVGSVGAAQLAFVVLVIKP